MPTNSVIDRNDAEALMPEEASREIFKQVPESSAIMSLARRLPNMSRAQQRLPVMSALPVAYFVDGDTGLKQTTEANWANVYLNVGEIAAIVPIPENVIDDSDYPIWSEVRPSLVEAIGQKLDRAVLYKEGAPSNWPDALLTQISDAGHAVVEGSVGTDLYDDLLAESGVLSLCEDDGYMVDGHLAALRMKAKLRGVRDTDGNPIFSQSMRETGAYTLDGEQLVFPKNGSVDRDEVLLVSGEWRNLVWAVRQDITWKLLDQAVISDDSGAIVYNLPQQDMVALRVKFRAGWALPNPPNRENPNDSSRFMFASLVPSSSAYS